MSDPLHLIVELVRADDASNAHGVEVGARQVYLMRDPDDTGRYAEGTFRWTRRVQSDLQALAEASALEDATARLARLVRRFLEGTPWSRYAPLVDAALAEGRSVVITIRSAAAELYALPWEFLPLANGTAAETPSCLVRYDLPDEVLRADRFQAADRDDPLACSEPQAPGRVVVAWSASAGAVPASEHTRAITVAARGGRLPFDPQADVVANVSRELLLDRLGQGDVAILHVLCHGVPLPGDQGFGLALTGADGDQDVVAPDEFAAALRPFVETLRLVVVQACHSGNPGGLECHADSVAQALHRVGIPMVLASRYPLSIPGSIRITDTLYRSLAGLTSLEMALTSARAIELATPSSFDWAALQLYADPEVGVDSRPIVVRPYRGLLPFESQHARFFFGREADVAALVERLRTLMASDARRLLLIAGASGSGKSSLVSAGLVPALARGAIPEFPHQAARSASVGCEERSERARLFGGRVADLSQAVAGRLVGLVQRLLQMLHPQAGRQATSNALAQPASPHPFHQGVSGRCVPRSCHPVIGRGHDDLPVDRERCADDFAFVVHRSTYGDARHVPQRGGTVDIRDQHDARVGRERHDRLVLAVIQRPAVVLARGRVPAYQPLARPCHDAREVLRECRGPHPLVVHAAANSASGRCVVELRAIPGYGEDGLSIGGVHRPSKPIKRRDRRTGRSTA